MSNTTNNNSDTKTMVYRAMVIDSGPIIKHTATRNLYGKANLYYTTPAVVQEIRDAKARQSLEQLPFELLEKEPSPTSLEQVIAFSKQTGDYASLSTVDLQVLALCLDLEREGCPDLEHIRSTPKRMIGLGPIQNLNGETKQQENEELKLVGVGEEEDDDDDDDDDDDEEETELLLEQGASFFTKPPEVAESSHSSKSAGGKTGSVSWAMLVNPNAGTPVTADFQSLSLANENTSEQSSAGGQFDDAEVEVDNSDNKIDDDDDSDRSNQNLMLQEELTSEFPSLAAAATVPYEGSDDEDEEEGEQKGIPTTTATNPSTTKTRQELAEEERERKKQEALKPLSKSGKLYNSFRKYGDLMKPAPPKQKTKQKPATTSLLNLAKDDDEEKTDALESRIMGTGNAGMISDMNEEDDDGEGWITCTKDIQRGRMVPKNGNQADGNDSQSMRNMGPPTSQRTACTTTDFAMQNVLLQMGLSLLSVDGMKIRRLKSWVHRCGACFRVHTDAEFQGMKRLFCSHCGSDMMQRIAASVDGKTGRLKLHLSKKYKHNLRGTKFSLPKAGSVSLNYTLLFF